MTYESVQGESDRSAEELFPGFVARVRKGILDLIEKYPDLADSVVLGEDEIGDDGQTPVDHLRMCPRCRGLAARFDPSNLRGRFIWFVGGAL